MEVLASLQCKAILPVPQTPSPLQRQGPRPSSRPGSQHAAPIANPKFWQRAQDADTQPPEATSLPGASALLPSLAAIVMASSSLSYNVVPVLAEPVSGSGEIAQLASTKSEPAVTLHAALLAFQDGNLGKFLDHFTADFTYSYEATPRMPFSGDYRGQDGLLRAVMGMKEHFDFELLKADVVGDDKNLVAVAKMDWKETSRKTGKTVVNTCMYWEQQNKNGKAVSATETCNSLLEYEATI